MAAQPTRSIKCETIPEAIRLVKSDEAKKTREEIEYWRQRAIFANTDGIPCEKDVNPEENDDQAGSDSDSDDDYHCFL